MQSGEPVDWPQCPRAVTCAVHTLCRELRPCLLFCLLSQAISPVINPTLESGRERDSKKKKKSQFHLGKVTWNRLSLWTVSNSDPYRFSTHEVEFSSPPYQPCMCFSFIRYLLVWISDPKRPRCLQSVALLGDNGPFSMWSLQELGH